MRVNLLIEMIRDAIRLSAACPPEEVWADMVKLGIIDEQGRVLKRFPEPPEASESKGEAPVDAAQPVDQNGST